MQDLSRPRLLTFFWNLRWRLPPSWIFSLCEFGDSGVLVVWYLCSVPNLVQISVIVTEIDAYNYASELCLMTSRELTSRHVVISAWPWCIFPYNLMRDIFIQTKVIDIFLKFTMAAAAILDFQFMWIWRFRRVGSVVSVFCTKFGSNICYSHWDRCTYASELHLMTSRFRLLVTWSSLHGRDASSHEIWCIYLYPIESYWYFSEIKDGGRRHLRFVWVSHETTHEALFVARTCCKNFVMIG